MKKAQRNSFKLNPIAASIILAMTSQLSANVAHAGSGWGAGINTSNVPVAVPTYYANSPVGPVPYLDATGAPALDPVTKLPVVVDTGKALRKFVDTLPGIPGITTYTTPTAPVGSPAGANNLGQYIPLAVPEKNWTNPVTGIATTDDYYEIAAIEFTEKMHSDLPKATHLRGYVQISTAKNPGKHLALTYPSGSPILDANGVQVYAYDNPHHLGPIIQATSGTAVRVKFSNYLPVGGELFIPVDTSITGAGLGPDGVTSYTQNRAEMHLVGGQTVWVSAGNPHQWVAPAGETAAYAAGLGKGVSAQNVPDMADPGPGSSTLYFPNTQSARLMFYQDRTSGLTRLNSYAGLEAGYFVTDPTEQALALGGTLSGGALTAPVTVAAGTIPVDQIPLIIEDKTFVPANIAQQDAKWDTTYWGQSGDLWFPHVYETNQDPNSVNGVNPVGRWDYGPWFWPIFPATQALPSGSHGSASFTPEAYEDTPVINGTAYPTLTVDPKAYRFRILNASNDRFYNLGLYKADTTVGVAPQLDQNGNPMVDASGNPLYFTGTEVKMVPAVADVGGNPLTPTYAGGAANTACLCQYPTLPQLTPTIVFSGPTRAWPTDSRVGGAPDPTAVGPDFIAIGNDGGLLPNPVDIPSQPVTYEQNRRSITVTNIYGYGLLLGPAERADAIVDFSQYAGQTLILYNDAPAPVPFVDGRWDYYTGDPDLTSTGGAYSTKPGYGPNTRTMMQIKVNAAPVAATGTFNANTLVTALPAAYAASQPAPIVPASAYNAAFKTNDTDTYGHVATGSVAQPTLDFTSNGTQTVTGVNLITSGGQLVVGTTNIVGNATPGSGTGYMSPPIVNFNNGSCLPAGVPSAAATAVIDTTSHQVTAVNLVNPRGYPGYTCAPTITFTPTASAGAGVISNIGLANGGTGYTAAPRVTITGGGGTGATATASIASPLSSAITVTNGGAGYSAPTVAITGGGGTGATATATVSTSTLSSAVTVTNGGSGYTAPTVAIAGGGGTGATATASIASPVSGTITMTNGGSGYTAPTVTITGGGGTGAVATATVGNAPISGISMVNTGAGYTSPTVTIAGGGGTGAVATATVASTPVSSVALMSAGAGYTSPTVTISGGGGTGAAATATVASTPISSLALGSAGTGYTSATVNFIGGGGTGAAGTATVGTTPVSSVTMVNGGAGYTSPTVTIAGGGGSGAAAAATIGSTPISSITVASGGTGYTSPNVNITGGGGANAVATATLGTSPVASIALSNGGSGYVSTSPAVNFIPVDGNGFGATASATVDPATGAVTGITITNAGSGYTSAPSMSIMDVRNGVVVRPRTPATATATVAATAGTITGITVSSAGAGFTSAPSITISDPTGTGATAIAALGATAGAVTGITLTSFGKGYATAPSITITDATGTGATATATLGATAGTVTGITLSSPGTGYTSAPTITIADVAGGAGKGATATAAVGTTAGAVTGITLSNPGAGYTSAPTITIADIAGGTGTGATATATVSPTAGAVTGITLSNPGTGYTSAPAITITDATGKGAAATATLAPAAGVVTGITVTNTGSGYTSAPTITIADATGKSALATASLASTAGTVTGITVTNVGSGYTTLPSVTLADATGTGALATAALQFGPGAVTGITLTNAGTGYTTAPTITLTGGAGTGASATAAVSGTAGTGAQATVVTSLSQSIPVSTKAEQELFDTVGRYNSTGGVEIPLTSGTTQTTIPLGYIDSPTEIIGNGETQVWKLVDNGFWSNSMHFDFVDVQLINRVGWDGTVKAPASNEVGWKDTLRLNPLEDVILAIRAKAPSLRFGLPNSIRPQDPSVPLGAAGSNLGFTADPAITIPTMYPGVTFQTVNAATVTNGGSGYTAPVLTFTGGGGTGAAGTATVTNGVITAVAISNAGTGYTSAPTITITDTTGTGAVLTANMLTSLLTTSTNVTANYANEYVWNSAVLGHSEDDFMRPIVFTPVVTLPNAPGNLAARGGTLTWTDPTPELAATTLANPQNEVGFIIQRAPSNGGGNGTGTFVEVARVPANSTSWVDPKAVIGTSYSYQVIAYNAAGNSSPSNTVTVRTQAPVPAAPTGVTAVAGAAGSRSITVNWTATNATSFIVQRRMLNPRTGRWGAWTTVANLAGANNTTFTNTGLTTGNSYIYQVQAVNAAGNSTWAASPTVVAP